MRSLGLVAHPLVDRRRALPRCCRGSRPAPCRRRTRWPAGRGTAASNVDPTWPHSELAIDSCVSVVVQCVELLRSARSSTGGRRPDRRCAAWSASRSRVVPRAPAAVIVSAMAMLAGDITRLPVGSAAATWRYSAMPKSFIAVAAIGGVARARRCDASDVAAGRADLGRPRRRRRRTLPAARRRPARRQQREEGATVQLVHPRQPSGRRSVVVGRVRRSQVDDDRVADDRSHAARVGAPAVRRRSRARRSR